MGSEVPVLIVISVKGVVPMDVLSFANCKVYSFRSASSLDSMLGFSFWQGGWKVSGFHFLDSDTIC